MMMMMIVGVAREGTWVHTPVVLDKFFVDSSSAFLFEAIHDWIELNVTESF